MKRIIHILIPVAAALLTGTALPSCIYDDGYDTNELPDNIHINTGTLDNAVAITSDPNNTFRLLFWVGNERAHLTNPSATWPLPYLSKGAPQHVQYYNSAVFDTGYPYPYPDTSHIYATGYAPDGRLQPSEDNNYRELVAKTTSATPTGAELSRIDFLACDYWPEVFRGSKTDPFAQPKNKLYFRHLAAKLVFIAIRDPKSMENLQHVRNVEIKNLQMSTDGSTWGPLWAPCTFEWQTLTDDDFNATYTSLISKIVAIPGNANTGILKPRAGYKATEAKSFAGESSDYVLKRGNNDRVPLDGQPIDSCYVCNDFDATATAGHIRLKMDISAELSYDPEYAKPDDPTTTTGSGGTTTPPAGSNTDNLTFDKEWLGMVVNEIKEVTVDAYGETTVSDTNVTSFKPGREYRIYVRFYRTGVSLVAREMPWSYGGIHYITFQPAGTTTPTPADNP